MESPIDSTLSHVLFLSRHLNHCDIRYIVMTMLLELGFPTKRIGFAYLVDAIILYSKDPTQVITKEIYPVIGKMYGSRTNWFQVERAIRCLIKDCWDDRDEKQWELYFPRKNGVAKRPTNAEFISRIALILELWQGCCKGEGCYER